MQLRALTISCLTTVLKQLPNLQLPPPRFSTRVLQQRCNKLKLTFELFYSGSFQLLFDRFAHVLDLVPVLAHVGHGGLELLALFPVLLQIRLQELGALGAHVVLQRPLELARVIVQHSHNF